MKNFKRKIIGWIIVTIFSIFMIGLCSYFISIATPMLELLKKVDLDTQISQTYVLLKAYSIGGLTFFLLLFVMGSIISYAGIRSWKYAQMFS